tara:strand:+ start:5047 stop:5919 length:873 start_codon:yes stop_codon:yes gene_type:complete
MKIAELLEGRLRLGIIGHGFVGKAVDYGFSNTKVHKKIIDPKYGNTPLDTEKLVNSNADLIFVCVPTPMGDDGDIDTSILDSVMSMLSNCSKETLIVIKSTVTPSVIEMYTGMCNVVYNPEFLTEKSACEQFVNPEFHIFGGNEDQTELLESYYDKYSLCNWCPSYHMTLEEASFVKYTINSFLATKVTFFNQLYDVCKSHGNVNFNKIIKAVGADERIAPSHTKVPGFDGKQGYGGACFPKDTLAFSKYSKELTLLNKAIEINNNYRSQYERDDREKEQNIQFNHVQTD